MKERTEGDLLKAERFYKLDGAYYWHGKGGECLRIDDVRKTETGGSVLYEGEDARKVGLFGSAAEPEDLALVSK